MKYSKKKADEYWSHRLKKTEDQINAVGYLGRNKLVNNEYGSWEKAVLKGIIKNLNLVLAADLGCGVGRLSNALTASSNLQKLFLIDLSKNMLLACKENLQKIDYFDNVELIFLDGASDNINLENNSLDFVMCMGVFEHIPETLQIETIREIHRVLKVGGNCALEINNTNSIFLNSKNIETNEFRNDTQLDNGYLCQVVSIAKILKALEQYNLSINKIFSNTNFSIISNLFNILDLSISEQENIMVDAHKYDLKPKNSILDKYSDQLILEIVKMK